LSNFNGKFVWHELMTTDADAARKFYSEVVGWQTRDAGIPGMAYTVVSVGEAGVGGIMTLPAEAAGAKPGWIGYIAVDDVDAYVGRVKQAGGAVHKPAQDIPGVGRFAVVADPQGAIFILFKGTVTEPPQQPSPQTPGAIGWNELHAKDWESAFGFYSGLFGWTKGESVDMGPMGTYQLFAAGAEAVGGMMSNFQPAPGPFWLYYFSVDAIDAAGSRVTANGGQVLQGPHEVPGGMWIMQCQDPQGASFALVGSRR
jgi:predicted enzyme related to lactoylglutathione lyase